MINVKFLVIVTAYNVEDWIERCLRSIQEQSHTNFRCVVGDDCSTDTTEKIFYSTVANDDRFYIVKTDAAQSGQGTAYLKAVDYASPKDNEIIIEVDGDDWLASDNALDHLNQIYKNPDIWMTYGQYEIYPSGKTGGHFDMDIPDYVDKSNTYRSHPFPYSHLKTYKTWLFNKVNRQDLIDPSTNKAWNCAWDHVLCFPMVEMAGKQHIYRCPEVLYILNRSDKLQNECTINTNRQSKICGAIRSMRPYKRLEVS